MYNYKYCIQLHCINYRDIHQRFQRVLWSSKQFHNMKKQPPTYNKYNIMKFQIIFIDLNNSQCSKESNSELMHFMLVVC